MKSPKLLIRKIPFVRGAATGAVSIMQRLRFRHSAIYWEKRYAKAGTSGLGSYNELAKMKADIVNSFVRDKNVSSLVELGCVIGNQLEIANYPRYTGLDVSRTAVERCQKKFTTDPTKKFFVVRPDDFFGKNVEFHADCALSLDVIYHLVEDATFECYMENLFALAGRFIIIYSSNVDDNETLQMPHVRHRRFSDWIECHRPDWSLVKTVRNPFAETKDVENMSSADFYFYRKL